MSEIYRIDTRKPELAQPARQSPWPRRLVAASLLFVLCVAGWFAWRAFGPLTLHGPDPQASTIQDLRSFIGSAEFTDLPRREQEAYLQFSMEKLKAMSFGELNQLLMTRARDPEQFRNNISAADPDGKLTGQMMTIWLDKYFELNQGERTLFLTGMVMMERANRGNNPDGFRLPTPEQLQKSMARFLSRQPPRTQAMMGQLMMDMKAHRQTMGYPAPF